jgi:hypothetical protein
MKGNIDHTVFSEEQAINITIENGYNGSEFETTVWKQRQCLKPNRTLEALISKLKTIYNLVEVEGTGKKRKYILKDKKSNITEREFNYKGSVPTPEDEIMTEYIFNHLLTYKNEYTKSYKGWAKEIGFIDTEKLSIYDMVSQIKNLHYGFPRIYNPKEVVSVFSQTLSTRNKDIIEKSFNRLAKDNRIKVTEVYNVRHINGEYGTITELEYNTFINCINDFLEQYDTTYYAYSQALTSIHKSKKMKDLINDVNDYLMDHFSIVFFFKTFKINVVNRTIKTDITKEEFNVAYFKRLIQLSEDRQSKDTYKDTITFWKKFYLINTLTLLKYINVTGIDELLHEQNKMYLSKLDEFDLDANIHNLETDMINEEIRHIFGNN